MTALIRGEITCCYLPLSLRLNISPLRAATQLDRLQRKLDSDSGVVRDFADAIETYTGLGEPPSTGCSFALDPISSEMFNARNIWVS